MNRLIVTLALGLATVACGARAETAPAKFEGRWQGVIGIPERPVDATVDIARNAKGDWIGSTDLPQLQMRGAALGAFTLEGGELNATLTDALAGPGENKASYQLHFGDDGLLHGEFHQGGWRTSIVLARIGDAQVQLPRPRGVVPKSVEGTWVGDFVGSGGYTRHVTMVFSTPDGNGSQATFHVEGKRTTDIPVSWLGWNDGFLQMESPISVGYEGKLSADGKRFTGTCTVAGSDYSLNLERAK